MKTLLSRFVCALRGHRMGRNQLATVHHGEIAKDAARRVCRCCGAVEVQIIPFRRFHNLSRAR